MGAARVSPAIGGSAASVAAGAGAEAAIVVFKGACSVKENLTVVVELVWSCQRVVLSRALAGWLWMQMLVHRWLWQQRLVSGAAASSLLLLVAVAPAPPRGGIVNKRFG